MSVPPLGLDEWFPPLDLHEFRRNVLGRDLLSIPPRPKLADRLLERLAIHSVDDLLKLRGAKVYAWFHQLDGRHTAAVIPASSGRRFYDAGTTLYFRNIVEFAACQHEVASAFGVPRSSVECTLFCNRPHAVTRAHFDTADIITIQLKGRKTWRIAPDAPAKLCDSRSYGTRTSRVRARRTADRDARGSHFVCPRKRGAPPHATRLLA